MKSVAHISDPHFGTEDRRIADELGREIEGLAPACVVVSGDLTQRGRRAQFQGAREWLDALELPVLAVPGNHDIPLYDLFTRFVRPRARYLRYITRELSPWFCDDELAIVGVDTTKSFTTKHGHVDRDRLADALGELADHPACWKILVAHHPFIVPPESRESAVDGAHDMLPLLEDAGVDLILTGHLHLPYSAGRNDEHTIVHVHAGTCMSTRTRGEPNGYNQLRFDTDEVTITHRRWDGQRFVDGAMKRYGRGRRERLVKLVEITPRPGDLRAP